MPKMDGKPPAEGLARPYAWLGLDLQGGIGDNDHADCPFCGKEGKWGVNRNDGKWQCWVCGASGNLTTFMREIWKQSSDRTDDYSDLARERPPIDTETLIIWETVKSSLDGSWLVPGYQVDGKIGTLYKWASPLGTTRPRLHLGPETNHYLSGCGPTQFDPKERTCYICEGAWDGMTLWQMLRKYNQSGNVVSVPGCKVFKPAWATIFSGKNVVLIPHNDHPREYPKASGRFVKPGWDGMARLAGILSSSEKPPASLRVVYWGPDGFDRDLKDGWDVRDHFGKGSVDSLLERIGEVPTEWLLGSSGKIKNAVVAITTRKCDSWSRVLEIWNEALEWRRCLEDVLAVCLAVCLSTEQAGDSQLFLQLIGDAGSAKTKFCDAMLTSPKCLALEHITGFHSGWKDGSGQDFSFLSRANRKTWVTPEGDVFMSNPRFDEIMSQQRRIFDGTSGATYKNQAEDKRWSGLRTPWIMAGTPALLDKDQSRLGDRFLRIRIDKPPVAEKRAIMRRVILTAARTVCRTSNGEISSHMDSSLAEAYAITGGYVDYLRENAEDLLVAVKVDHEQLIDKCSVLAEYIADLRARPANPRYVIDAEATKELPSRVAAQLVRLAICLGAVLQRYAVDQEVMRIVAKVAIDTAWGRTASIAEYLWQAGEDGTSLNSAAIFAKVGEERARTLLEFMRQLDMVVKFKLRQGQSSYERWRLSERLREVLDEVMGY
jgi:hypothetical protein